MKLSNRKYIFTTSSAKYFKLIILIPEIIIMCLFLAKYKESWLSLLLLIIFLIINLIINYLTEPYIKINKYQQHFENIIIKNYFEPTNENIDNKMLKYNLFKVSNCFRNENIEICYAASLKYENINFILANIYPLNNYYIDLSKKELPIFTGFVAIFDIDENKINKDKIKHFTDTIMSKHGISANLEYRPHQLYVCVYTEESFIREENIFSKDTFEQNIMNYIPHIQFIQDFISYFKNQNTKKENKVTNYKKSSKI